MRKLSRRGFLGGIGVGAGVLAAQPAKAFGVINEIFDDAPAAAAPSAVTFGRIFGIPAFAPASSAVVAALSDIGKAGGLLDAKDDLSQGPAASILDPTLSPNHHDNPRMTAGFHFLGQLIDHDLTFDLTSTLGVPAVPEQTRNQRTPALDLDNVYGGGPQASPKLYDPADPAKFLVQSGGQFEDVPREADGTAIIADPRNDENMMISGLHVAILKFHNNVVDALRAQGVRDVFNAAHRTVLWHYQWIILHEYLPANIGQDMTTAVLSNGLLYFDPYRTPFMPIEFSAAAFRFGHAQIRPSYRANLKGDNGSPFFGFIFDPAGEGQADPVDLRGGFRAPRRFIGWQTFFDFGDGQVKQNKLIKTAVSTPLFQLPLSAIATHDQPVSLMARDMLRMLTWSLPSGQRLAEFMGDPVIDAGHFPELAKYGLGLDANTPPLYYILREADLVNGGTHLGPVGGRIIGETIIGLMLVDPGAFLSSNPNWTPTLPSATPGTFTMVDLLKFAKVDPASRGQ
ncbi:peroxidase family protein [Actinocrispum wychmicini]|uniref:Secreted protein n=1 Tax=Actinocrispum wychmicini TaxID=1213861 RepID=A0A4R2K3M3_9PSEU|nr:peroxidase family protein [Actinocrispum wychmicini]TCO64406.1 secreted protein [Actinocrispum wychmicini]